MDLALERRAFALLREALDREPAQRDAFVEAHCAGDTALTARLRELLIAAEGSSDVLDGSAAQLAARLEASADDLPAGTQLGAWRVLHALGRGGMGAVYLAEREGDGFVQRCAVKLIKRGMDSAEVLARFRRERQILARLLHPHLARLVDGGVSEDGRPWLAMEYVEGEPLSTFAARREVDIGARVALLLSLADAVAYAHRQLVVHRDLKPSNVLVDGNQAPHLLDFGIARLLEDTEQPERTATAARFITRAYAAPEQERGESAGTATDVYQLGVLAFELLSGARFHGNTAVNARPTQRLVEARTALGAGGPAAVPPRALHGDLGVIVARATDPDPARRYASVDAFAEDLRRWREGRAILARSDSTGYRFMRFVTRHRVAVGAAAITLVAILSGAGVALWQAHAARLATQRAESVNGFLENLFKSIDPENARGRTVTAKELVDNAAARLGGELAAQPAAAARLHNVLGATYLALGDYAAAETQYRAALPLFAVEQAALAVDTRHGLARIAETTGRLKEAAVLLDESEELRRTQRPDDVGLRDLIVQERASIASDSGDAEQAAKLGEQALASRRMRLGSDANETLDSEQSLAVYRREQGRPAEALALIEHVIVTVRRTDGDESPRLASPLFNRAVFLAELGDYAGSLASAEECLALRRRILPPNHPDIARTLGRKAQDLNELGRVQESLALRGEIVAILRAPAQPDRDLLAQELNNWGVGCYRAGDIDCAVTHIGEALAIWQSDLPPDHSNVLTARTSLAALETNRGHLAEGEKQLRAVLAQREAAFASGSNAALLDGWLNNSSALMANLRFQQRSDEALAITRAAMQRADAGLAAPHLQRSIARSNNAAVLADLGDCAAAQPLGRSALEEARALAPAGALERGLALQVLGRCALQGNDADTARQQLDDAVTALTEGGSAEHWRTMLARAQLGLAEAASGQTAKARSNLDIAIGALTATRPWLPDLAAFRAARARLH